MIPALSILAALIAALAVWAIVSAIDDAKKAHQWGQ